MNERKKEQNKELDIEQIYGHGSQRGLMPGVNMPAGCQQQASASASAELELMESHEMAVKDD
jgi:hypothetical protein